MLSGRMGACHDTWKSVKLYRVICARVGESVCECLCSLDFHIKVSDLQSSSDLTSRVCTHVRTSLSVCVCE